MKETTNSAQAVRGNSQVNGLSMYYEIHGDGQPLVLIHGGGSTIETTFGKIIPFLSVTHQLIAVELQAHGRTSDRDMDSSFEQDADDVATLLGHLGIAQADIFGFSNGATTAFQIAIRHPSIVKKLVLVSPLAKRNGMPDWFWEFMENASLDNMPQLLQDGYRAVAPDPEKLQVMHDRDAKRMVHFKDIPDEDIIAIKAPTLVVVGDRDVITVDHCLELHRQIANSRLAVLPGVHGECIGEITTINNDFHESDLIVPMIKNFLQASDDKQ
jgi:pimeloyl-ACP methyl ester carboxylesterase